MPRPSNTFERQNEIAQALIRVMARRGYHGAAVSEIAREAGLNPGLIHYHFGSKRGVLLRAAEDLIAEHERALMKQLAAADVHPAAQLDAFIDYHLGRGHQADPERLASWIVISAEATRSTDVRDVYEQALEGLSLLLQTLIGRGVDQGVFRCDSIPAAAAALLAAIEGYYVLAATVRTLIPAHSAAPAVRAMATGLLATGQALE